MSIDDTPLMFGSYKGLTPNQVADIDPRYVVWMFRAVKPAPCSKKLAEACQMDEYDEGAEAEDLHYGIDGWGDK